MSDSAGTGPGPDDAPDAFDDVPDDGDDEASDELEPADAVPAGTLAGGSTALGATATATRPARRGPVTRVRSIGTFYRQVVAELRKVIWPTRQQLVTYTTVVVVFVVVMVAIVSLFDFAFSQAVLRVFGDSSL